VLSYLHYRQFRPRSLQKTLWAQPTPSSTRCAHLRNPHSSIILTKISCHSEQWYFRLRNLRDGGFQLGHITGIFPANICQVLKHVSGVNRGSVLTLFTNEVKQDKRPLGHICIITGCWNCRVELKKNMRGHRCKFVICTSVFWTWRLTAVLLNIRDKREMDRAAALIVIVNKGSGRYCCLHSL
jgi:hypothetical protein